MARAMQQVPLKEKSNFKQGRSGSGTMTKSGPAASGKKRGNKPTGGGITKATRGKFKS